MAAVGVQFPLPTPDTVKLPAAIDGPLTLRSSNANLVPIATLFDEMKRVSGLRFEADPAFSQRRLFLELCDVRVSTVMEGLRRSIVPYGHGARWMRTSTGFRLAVDPAGRRLLRDDVVREERRFLDQMDDAMRYLYASDGERKRLLARWPEIAQLYERWGPDGKLYRQCEPYFFNILNQCFSPSQLQAIIRGEDTGQVHFREMNRPLQEAIQEAIRAKSIVWRVDLVPGQGAVQRTPDQCSFRFEVEGGGMERALKVTILDPRSESPDDLTLRLCPVFRFKMTPRLYSELKQRRAQAYSNENVAELYRTLNALVVEDVKVERRGVQRIIEVTLMVISKLKQRVNVIMDDRAASASLFGHGTQLIDEIYKRLLAGDNVPVDDALDRIAATFGCQWELAGRNVVVFCSVRDVSVFLTP